MVNLARASQQLRNTPGGAILGWCADSRFAFVVAADALNFALERIDEELYVGIDADGVIAHDAITNLVPHFADPKIGAVAGNAKVGNRVNLWTRWQALEYITSQNFERRALDLFDVVMGVLGPDGAGA